MCKSCGFADHAHKTWPCPKCDVPHSELFSEASLKNGVFLSRDLQSNIHMLNIEYRARDGEDFRRKCHLWRDLKTDQERTKFFEEHGVRWTEFARLPYFDIIRCTIIDPMHNILQGIVKNQWYSCWIKRSTLRSATTTRRRELDAIHDFMDTVSGRYM